VSGANAAAGGNIARRALSTDRASKPVARYSQGVAAAGLVFTAGQGAHDPDTAALPDGIEAQTRRTLENIDAILRAGGASLATAVKITVYLADRQDYAAMNATYDRHMPAAPPARTTVQAGLGSGMLIEIDAIAIAIEKHVSQQGRPGRR
jgi:2-iminobutanoate/2-iminopropanoate deaminase